MRIERAPSLTGWALWHCVAAVAVSVIPGQLILGKPVWVIAREQPRFLIGMALAYLASAVLIRLRPYKGDATRLRDLVLAWCAGFGAYALFLLLTKSYFDRTALVAALVLSGIFLFLPFALAQSARSWVVAAVAGVIVLLLVVGDRPRELLEKVMDQGPKPQRSTKTIDSTLYSIKSVFFDRYVGVCPSTGARCQPPRPGGGISTFDRGYLLATGEGVFHFLSYDTGKESLESRLLPYRVPLNSDAFVAATGADGLWKFRVTDILVQDRGDAFRLFAAHHYWSSERRCLAVRVSSLDSDYASFLAGRAQVEWKTVYDTQPCLSLTGGEFYGDESGGRLASLANRGLLLSVGDLSRDGLNGGPALAQDKSSAYGKTVLIDVNTGKGEIYSVGHRNPQGLYVGPDGAVWLTEHGPRGGDELNLISRGGNYGWPFATYGTHNLSHSWPLGTNQGEHDGFRAPVYAWLPDIAVSNLIGVEGDLFRAWKQDLLVASLKKALWRVRVREERVVYAEPIELRSQNARIRDVMEDRDGRIVLWLDGGTIAILEPSAEQGSVADGIAGSDSMRGQLLFARCRGCHNVQDGTAHGAGPDLSGIVGRRIAGATGFEYSTALRHLSGTWSEDQLDAFLASPQRFVAGTSMAFEGIRDPTDRAKLIGYLKTLR